jgi:hypothetical protein
MQLTQQQQQLGPDGQPIGARSKRRCR